MLLDDLAAELAATGLGTVGTTIFMGYLPDLPDGCLVVSEYAGRPPVFEHDDVQPALRFPRVQVLVRDSDPALARGRAASASAALCAVLNRTLGGTTVLAIRPLGEPFPLERDAAGRLLLACNYEITY